MSGSQQEVLSLSSWQLVARIDNDLGLLGIGALESDDEELLWLKPTENVEVRLSLMEEEN